MWLRTLWEVESSFSDMKRWERKMCFNYLPGWFEEQPSVTRVCESAWLLSTLWLQVSPGDTRLSEVDTLAQKNPREVFSNQTQDGEGEKDLEQRWADGGNIETRWQKTAGTENAIKCEGWGVNGQNEDTKRREDRQVTEKMEWSARRRAAVSVWSLINQQRAMKWDRRSVK